MHPHTSALSPSCFVQGASLKGNPEANTCLALADQILTDGFITANDPLYVINLGPDVSSPPFNTRVRLTDNVIRARQIGYAKVGMQFMVLRLPAQPVRSPEVCYPVSCTNSIMC
jgi:hypothetical protein